MFGAWAPKKFGPYPELEETEMFKPIIRAAVLRAMYSRSCSVDNAVKNMAVIKLCMLALNI